MTTSQQYVTAEKTSSYASLVSEPNDLSVTKNAHSIYASADQHGLLKKEDDNRTNGSQQNLAPRTYVEEQLQQLQEEIARLRSEEYTLKMKEQVVQSDITVIQKKLQQAHE